MLYEAGIVSEPLLYIASRGMLESIFERFSGCHVFHNANFQGVFLYNFLHRLSQGMLGLIFGAFSLGISVSRRYSVIFLDIFEFRYIIYHWANSKQYRTKPSKDCSIS